MHATLFDIDVRHYTTFGISARASALAVYDNIAGLREIADDESLPRPFKAIGSGSNLLFTSDFSGTLLLSRIMDLEFESSPENPDTILVRAGAGLEMDYLIDKTVDSHLWGMENLSGIPGTVGASAVQNVGAYGVEAADIIEKAEVFDLEERRIKTLSNSEMRFAYRHSIFKEPQAKDRYIVLFVTFRLSISKQPKLRYGALRNLSESDVTPADVRDEVIRLRDSKLPSVNKYGSAGSFFKNPVINRNHFAKIRLENPDTEVPCYDVDDDSVKIPAAWLIDRCGLKGKQIGGAAVWPSQPLVIYNASGNASAGDVVNLCNDIVDNVSRRFDITLQPEVEFIH